MNSKTLAALQVLAIGESMSPGLLGSISASRGFYASQANRIYGSQGNSDEMRNKARAEEKRAKRQKRNLKLMDGGISNGIDT